MITWGVEITVLDLATKRFFAEGTRTDDATGETTEVSIEGTWDPDLNPQENADKIRDWLWAQYQDAASASGNAKTFLGTLAADLGTALEALEV